MDYYAVGQTLNVAARMEHMAVPGSILISADTLTLAEGLQPLLVVFEDLHWIDAETQALLEAASWHCSPCLRACEADHRSLLSTSSGVTSLASQC
jgi:hypothetical protein